MKKRYWFLVALKYALGYILYFMVLAWVIMKLWNGLIPEITGWSGLAYNNALILLLLVRLLVGFRFKSAKFFKHTLKNKCTNLSDTEREDLRKKFRDRWCQKD